MLTKIAWSESEYNKDISTVSGRTAVRADVHLKVHLLGYCSYKNTTHVFSVNFDGCVENI